jgi:hypothetical protein
MCSKRDPADGFATSIGVHCQDFTEQRFVRSDRRCGRAGQAREEPSRQSTPVPKREACMFIPVMLQASLEDEGELSLGSSSGVNFLTGRLCRDVL